MIRQVLFCCVGVEFLFLMSYSFGNAQPEKSSTVSERLIAALIAVESGGNDTAVGDRTLPQHAYGCLQIRQPVCDDVNRHCGTSYRATDCQGNRALSIAICLAYIVMYANGTALGRVPTNQDRARIWNGGPHGWKHRNTVAYWEKVRRVLEE